MLRKIFSFLVYLSIAAFTFVILSVTFGSNESFLNNNTPNGELISYSNCKIPGDTSNCFGHTLNEDCIDYKYDGNGLLQLKHINSVFSLFPGELKADITISKGSILIEEFETGIGSLEKGLYNLDFVINDLKPNIYSIRIISPYPENKENLEFNVDLTQAGNGSFHLIRNVYPWGT